MRPTSTIAATVAILNSLRGFMVVDALCVCDFLSTFPFAARMLSMASLDLTQVVDSYTAVMAGDYGRPSRSIFRSVCQTLKRILDPFTATSFGFCWPTNVR